MYRKAFARLARKPHNSRRPHNALPQPTRSLDITRCPGCGSSNRRTGFILPGDDGVDIFTTKHRRERYANGTRSSCRMNLTTNPMTETRWLARGAAFPDPPQEDSNIETEVSESNKRMFPSLFRIRFPERKSQPLSLQHWALCLVAAFRRESAVTVALISEC